MKPEVDEILGRTAATLLTQVAPTLEGSYAGGHAGAAGMMAAMAAQEFDKAVDMRLAQADRMTAIFLAAEPNVEDAELKARLAEAAALGAENYRISTLNELNAQRAEVLIALHAYVEETDADWARDIEAQIWRHLIAEAAERMPVLPQVDAE